ncbi:MAG: diaminopimelate epimerase [Cytophagales bacterium]|nr:diaminopimelate epimerase [Cytophagales bacterium]
MGLLSFYKYQGTGNDFVMIDNRSGHFDPTNIALVQKLCNRKFGIGADGLILIQNSQGYDFEMVYFNSDGSQSLCGNGSRCAVNFAKKLGIIQSQTRFLAIDGPHDAIVEEELGIVHLKMGDVKEIEKGEGDFYINTGSPHWVQPVNGLQGYDVFAKGREIRYNDRFKEKGTNVNFIEPLENQVLFVRTYERGVEDETLSCGTGVTACALAASSMGFSSPVKIKALGGDLKVSFDGDITNGFSNIWLIGPAVEVFSGEVEV